MSCEGVDEVHSLLYQSFYYFTKSLVLYEGITFSFTQWALVL